MKNKGYWLLLGLTLFLLGLTSLIMQMVGVRWVFLEFLEWGGGLTAFVAKVVMLMVGILIIVAANTDWERERRECGGEEE
ncbi:MAG TPA: hypothetical protein PKD78_06650 [Saprospiraceae bacterium]|nr:hypothetical protein [Saprospiraceae bacterium]